MLLLLAAVALLCITGSISLFLTYIVTVMTNQSLQASEPMYNAIIALEFGLVVQNIVNTIGDIATTVCSTGLTFIANIRSNFKRYFLIASLVLFSYAYKRS